MPNMLPLEVMLVEPPVLLDQAAELVEEEAP